MSKTAQAIISLLLVATCTALFVQPGLAQQLPPQIPGLFPPGTPNDIVECWSSLLSIPGCVWEIYSSLFTGQIGNIGPACCQAILTVQENCWPKLFPVNHFFPSLLKNRCAPVGSMAFAPAVGV